MHSLSNSTESYDALLLLGATATGKTALGVALARALDGEIISADSRQVYRGLDIGSGKDINEYTVDGETVPYHLIDCLEVDEEFNVFEFQKRAYRQIEEIRSRGKLPIVVGGTGLYLDSLLNGYRMIEVPENPALRESMNGFTQPELLEQLKGLKENLHNETDTHDRDRLIRAIEIEKYTQSHPPEPSPELNLLVMGLRYQRPILHDRIKARLRARFEEGLIEEVEGLLALGVSQERLHMLGLEYRYVAGFLRGSIKNENDLFQKLLPAIKNFAKRQETWFRRMEKKGKIIHWLDHPDVDKALALVQRDRL
jgi:tRNA dimethylallyltransferase